VAYSSLKAFISQHGVHSTRVTFGLELGHHFAINDDGTTSVRPLKGDPFKSVLDKLRTGIQLTTLALGAFNSYVALYEDGSFQWTFRPSTSYPELKQLLSRIKTGDLRVSLPVPAPRRGTYED